MKVLKLPWLSHRAENKTLECYALDVNTAGTKLASGGLDGKVKVWDVPLILQYQENVSSGAGKDAPDILHRMNTPTPPLQRPLASMTRHNGVVTSVKFSPDGRFLASGSDDKIVLIWEKDDELVPRPKQLGETEADLEHWTVRKRLVAHDNDVQDICWSPDGQLLITVGLDRLIIIWNGTTFERIKRYDIHQLMVKGVVFDPANKFFATASDDRSVRIFRYYKKLNDHTAGNYEFQMEQIVMDPFRKSPLTSYFRRMSWSPNGQHVAVPNATNGPVTAVAIINRGTWATDVSLIGHEAPCEVCLFSPRLFALAAAPEVHSAVLASAGQDRSLAIWSTALPKPLVVLQDMARKPITDLAWTPDGMALFASLLDGSITCVVFAKGELGDPVSGDAVGSLLERYGGDRDLSIMAESVPQLWLERLARDVVGANRGPLKEAIGAVSGPSLGPAKASAVPQASLKLAPLALASPSMATTLSPKRAKKPANTVVITKSGKKRVAPTLVSTYSAPLLGSGSHGAVKHFTASSKLSHTPYKLPKLGLATAVHGLRTEHDTFPTGTQGDADADNDNEDMGFDDPNSSQLQTLTAAGIRLKMKKFRRLLVARKYPTPFRYISSVPEALFSNHSLMNSELARLVQAEQASIADTELINTSALDLIDETMFFRVIVNSTGHMADHGAVRSVVEVRNGPSWPDDEEILNTDPVQRADFQDPTQVLVTHHQGHDNGNGHRSYALYFPFKIQHVVPVTLLGRLCYYVLVSFDGVVQIVRAQTGSYLCPSFELGANVVFLKQKGVFFMLLTSAGLIYCWKFPDPANGGKGLTSVLSRVSVAPAIHSETYISSDIPGKALNESKPPLLLVSVLVDNVKALDVDENTGLPIIVMQRTGSVFRYSPDLMAWTKALDPWYLLAFTREEELQMEEVSLDKTLFSAAVDLKHEKILRGETKRQTATDLTRTTQN